MNTKGAFTPNATRQVSKGQFHAWIVCYLNEIKHFVAHYRQTGQYIMLFQIYAFRLQVTLLLTPFSLKCNSDKAIILLTSAF